MVNPMLVPVHLVALLLDDQGLVDAVDGDIVPVARHDVTIGVDFSNFGCIRGSGSGIDSDKSHSGSRTSGKSSGSLGEEKEGGLGWIEAGGPIASLDFVLVFLA